jgi:squalene synthase HpnC
MLTADAPSDAGAERVAGVGSVNLTAAAVMARAASENFPVATRVLPASARAHLLAVYGFARLADELGDADGIAPAERLAALDWLQAELDRAFGGQAEHPLLVRLQASVRECGLTREPFVRLIEANRLDQRVKSYESWAQLQGYCTLSADPVGELVLEIFGLATPARIALSDSICTALQLAEHCQDVAEDLARGRVYLPREDLERFNCSEADLARAHANGPVRAVLAFEVARARALLADGAPLIAQLRGRPKIAVAAFLAGGSAALGAIERARYDVLAGPPRSGRAQRAFALAATLYASRNAAR